MSHRPTTSTLAIAALALPIATLLLASPSPASADFRVAVLPFDGPDADRAREDLADALREQRDVRIAPLDRTDRAVAGAHGSEARELATRRLGADYVVSGRVQRRGRRERVSLILSDEDGRTLARRTVSLRDGRGSYGAAARALARGLESAADRDDDRGGWDDEPEEDRHDEERDRPRASRREEREHRRAPRDGRGPPLLELYVGARVEGRLARFTTEEGNVHRNDVAYPVLTGMVNARPWVAAEGLERGLEMRGFFGYAVGLRSRNTLTDEPVDTSFFHVYLDVGMLFEVVPSAELGLGLGFGWDSFAFGEQSLIVVPSAEYAFLRPHLRGRFQLEEELAVLSIELAYRGVLSRGALSEHFGQDGQTQGFDLLARLTGSVDIGLSYGIEAGVAGYFHFFDGEAITAHAKDGTDFALWLGAHVGFAFR
ncbi:MAG: hypothetical protein AB7S26_03840 [Sandaracinaceae bacterium]